MPSAYAVEVDRGTHDDAQLATTREDIRGVVLIAGHEGSETGGRLREPIDLFLERGDLIAGLAQGLRQALVLIGDGSQGALGVAEPQFKGARDARRLGQSTLQIGKFGL